MISSMITKEKNKPSGKSILLFSGGLDSVLHAFLLKPNILLHIPHGTRSEAAELKNVLNYKSSHNSEIIIDRSLRLGELERDDAIIPLRNLYFLTLASNYGEVLYLGGMSGDRSLDKSQEFFQSMEKLLTYLYQEQHWCTSRSFSISAPFKHKTKSELLAEYLEKGGESQAILRSRSCYEEKEVHCGWCKACFRKWVALSLNISIPKSYFMNDPLQAPWLPILLPDIKKQKYRGKEDLDTIAALKLSGMKI